jgi:trimethylamine---corrinoid protein Co-methyltransferase
MATNGFVRTFAPLAFLSEGQMGAINDGALDVLKTTGLQFESRRALEILERAGARVDHESSRARMDAELVARSLEQCPHVFEMRASDPANSITIGDDNVYFSLFSGMRTVDLDTWDTRIPSVEENNDACKIADGLEFVHASTSYTPYCDFEGEPPAMLLPISTWSRLKYFSKISRVGAAVDSHIFELQMAQAADVDVYGAFEASPPLTYTEAASDCAIACAELGYPVEPGCGGVMGGSHPATLSGALVAAIAEIMGGIVLVQAVNAGNAVIVNSFETPQNMRSGSPRFGAISISLFQVCWNQFWRTLYGIPVMNAGIGPSDSHQIDFQNGYEKALGMLVSAMSGANVINTIGGLTGELSYHPAQSVLDNDIAGSIVRFLEGVDVSDETLAIDLINSVGPIPGFFLDQMHTLQWWRKETYLPHAADTLPYPEWQKSGRKTALDYAQERCDQLLAEFEPKLSPGQEDDLDRILADARKHYQARDMA